MVCTHPHVYCCTGALHHHLSLILLLCQWIGEGEGEGEFGGIATFCNYSYMLISLRAYYIICTTSTVQGSEVEQ